MTENIELKWQRLRNINEPDSVQGADVRGVYCWGFLINHQFVPYYVGIAEDIQHRIFEHVNSIISGKYTLFHKDVLHEFKKFKKNKESDISTKGKIYIPDWSKGYANFLAKRKELQEHIDFMVDHFTFSYAIVDKSICDKNLLKEIEKKCIEQIKIKNLINTKGGVPKDIYIKHAGDEIVAQIFK